MRRSRGVVSAAVAALAALVRFWAAPATAAPITVGMSNGVGIPIASFGKLFGVGYTGGVYADYWIKSDYSFGADLTGSFNSLKGSLERELVVEADAKVIEVGGHARWTPTLESGVASPWLQYGMGVVTILSHAKDATGKHNDSETDLGLDAALGLDFLIRSSFKLGLGGGYHFVLTPDVPTQYFTIVVNLSAPAHAMR